MMFSGSNGKIETGIAMSRSQPATVEARQHGRFACRVILSVVFDEIHQRQRLFLFRLSNWMLVFDLCHFAISIVRAATRRDRRICGLLCKSGRRKQNEHDGNFHGQLQTVNIGFCFLVGRTIKTYHFSREVPKMLTPPSQPLAQLLTCPLCLGAAGNRASVFHFYLAGARIASSLSGVVSTLSKCG